jgi:hypothetical protein
MKTSISLRLAGASCCLVAVALALPVVRRCHAKGFALAVATVGAQTELPLERIASSGTLGEGMTGRSPTWPEHAMGSGGRPRRALGVLWGTTRAFGISPTQLHRAPGYRRTITNPKDWT